MEAPPALVTGRDVLLQRAQPVLRSIVQLAALSTFAFFFVLGCPTAHSAQRRHRAATQLAVVVPPAARSSTAQGAASSSHADVELFRPTSWSSQVLAVLALVTVVSMSLSPALRGLTSVGATTRQRNEQHGVDTDGVGAEEAAPQRSKRHDVDTDAGGEGDSSATGVSGSSVALTMDVTSPASHQAGRHRPPEAEAHQSDVPPTVVATLHTSSNGLQPAARTVVPLLPQPPAVLLAASQVLSAMSSSSVFAPLPALAPKVVGGHQTRIEQFLQRAKDAENDAVAAAERALAAPSAKAEAWIADLRQRSAALPSRSGSQLDVRPVAADHAHIALAVAEQEQRQDEEQEMIAEYRRRTAAAQEQAAQRSQVRAWIAAHRERSALVAERAARQGKARQWIAAYRQRTATAKERAAQLSTVQAWIAAHRERTALAKDHAVRQGEVRHWIAAYRERTTAAKECAARTASARAWINAYRLRTAMTQYRALRLQNAQLWVAAHRQRTSELRAQALQSRQENAHAWVAAYRQRTAAAQAHARPPPAVSVSTSYSAVPPSYPAVAPLNSAAPMHRDALALPLSNDAPAQVVKAPEPVGSSPAGMQGRASSSGASVRVSSSGVPPQVQTSPATAAARGQAADRQSGQANGSEASTVRPGAAAMDNAAVRQSGEASGSEASTVQSGTPAVARPARSRAAASDARKRSIFDFMLVDLPSAAKNLVRASMQPPPQQQLQDRVATSSDALTAPDLPLASSANAYRRPDRPQDGLVMEVEAGGRAPTEGRHEASDDGVQQQEGGAASNTLPAQDLHHTLSAYAHQRPDGLKGGSVGQAEAGGRVLAGVVSRATWRRG